MAAPSSGDGKEVFEFDSHLYNCVFVGKTGHCKTHLIKFLKNDFILTKQPLNSQTVTTGCKIQRELKVNLWDTPGLCDSGGRDQLFLNEMIQHLQKATRMHRVYFCLKATEDRADASLVTAMVTVSKLFDTSNGKIIKVIITKCDKEEPEEVERKRELWKDYLKDMIKPVEILACSNENMSELIKDIKSIDGSDYIQTSFMQQVEEQNNQIVSLRTRAQQTKDEVEKMRLEMEILKTELKQKDQVIEETHRQQQEYINNSHIFEKIGKSLGQAIDFAGLGGKDLLKKAFGCSLM